MNQNIGARDQLLENLEAFGLVDIERDATFVGIKIKKQPAGLGIRFVARKRTARPSAISNPRPLDLDDLGAHVRQQLAAIGSRHHLAKFDNL